MWRINTRYTLRTQRRKANNNYKPHQFLFVNFFGFSFTHHFLHMILITQMSDCLAGCFNPTFFVLMSWTQNESEYCFFFDSFRCLWMSLLVLFIWIMFIESSWILCMCHGSIDDIHFRIKLLAYSVPLLNTNAIFCLSLHKSHFIELKLSYCKSIGLHHSSAIR